MRPHRPFRPRCLAAGMIFAWIVAIYLSAALIAAAGVLPGYGGRGVADVTWELTDQVSFAAKLGYAAALTALLLGSRLISMPRPVRTALDVILACAAMLLVLALLPQDWSAGFGIGLTGRRFDADTLPRYLIAAAVSGLTFTIADAKCRDFDYPAGEDSTA